MARKWFPVAIRTGVARPANGASAAGGQFCTLIFPCSVNMGLLVRPWRPGGNFPYMAEIPQTVLTVGVLTVLDKRGLASAGAP